MKSIRVKRRKHIIALITLHRSRWKGDEWLYIIIIRRVMCAHVFRTFYVTIRVKHTNQKVQQLRVRV